MRLKDGRKQAQTIVIQIYDFEIFIDFLVFYESEMIISGEMVNHKKNINSQPLPNYLGFRLMAQPHFMI